jgi:hypothetical protein
LVGRRKEELGRKKEKKRDQIQTVRGRQTDTVDKGNQR